jgi:hypothetical protein
VSILETHRPPAKSALRQAGLLFTGFGILVTIWMVKPILEHRALALDGVIVSSSTECDQDDRSRCVSTYVLRTSTNETVTHKAGDGESDLPQNLTVGTKVVKRSGEFSYRINGGIVDGSPGLLELLFFGMPLLCLAVGVWLLTWRG